MGGDWNYGNKSSSLLPPASQEPMHGFLRFETAIDVHCETLDQFCQARGVSRIDFLHMDVQGAESLVLQGATHTLPRVVAIWLEVANQELYRGQKLRAEMERYMRSRHFALTFYHDYGAEGDQLYVNLRTVRGALFAAAFRVFRLVRRLRAKSSPAT